MNARVATFVLLIASSLFAMDSVNDAPMSEADHCERLAPKYDAQIEVRLWDGTRVDLLTESEAIEVDFARKWPEAIGQSCYYAIVTGKDPAIVLLADLPRESHFVYRCQAVCVDLGIALYIERIDK